MHDKKIKNKKMRIRRVVLMLTEDKTATLHTASDKKVVGVVVVGGINILYYIRYSSV